MSGTCICGTEGDRPVYDAAFHWISGSFRLFSCTYELAGNVKAIVKPRFVLPDHLKNLEELSILTNGRNIPGGAYLDMVVKDCEKGDSMGAIH